MTRNYRPPVTPERYYVAWVSVDGAGQLNPADRPYDLGDAILVCDQAQARADSSVGVDGAGNEYRNPWHYSHRVVDHRYQTVYRPGEPFRFKAA